MTLTATLRTENIRTEDVLLAFTIDINIWVCGPENIINQLIF